MEIVIYSNANQIAKNLLFQINHTANL